MTVFLLIRHALCDGAGKKFSGRLPDVHLNEAGRDQAERLAARLAGIPVSAVLSSPLERAIETAAPLALRHGLEIEVTDNLGELNAGDWTGCEFRDLSGLKHWRSFNHFRSCTRAPGGELMLEAQLRIVAELERLDSAYHGGIVAVISHGDVIKAAIAHYAGVHLDLFQRIEISPCSLSIVALYEDGPIIYCINNTGSLPEFLGFFCRKTDARDSSGAAQNGD